LLVALGEAEGFFSVLAMSLGLGGADSAALGEDSVFFSPPTQTHSLLSLLCWQFQAVSLAKLF
jgi:hypothetical protein